MPLSSVIRQLEVYTSALASRWRPTRVRVALATLVTAGILGACSAGDPSSGSPATAGSAGFGAVTQTGGSSAGTAGSVSSAGSLASGGMSSAGFAGSAGVNAGGALGGGGVTNGGAAGLGGAAGNGGIAGGGGDVNASGMSGGGNTSGGVSSGGDAGMSGGGNSNGGGGNDSGGAGAGGGGNSSGGAGAGGGGNNSGGAGAGGGGNNSGGAGAGGGGNNSGGSGGMGGSGGSGGSAGLGGNTNADGTITGSPAIPKLLDVTKSCSAQNAIPNSHTYALDNNSLASICSLKGGTGNSGGAIYYTADMDIDCDGLTTTHCPGTGPDMDCCYYDSTAFHGPSSGSNKDGPALKAEFTPYIVLPQDVVYPGLDMDNGGHIVAVLYNNELMFGVLGDTGPTDIIGEASYRTAQCLGIPPSPATGGVGSGVTYIFFVGPGTQPKDMEDVNEVRQLGQKLVQSLLANNP